MDIIQALLMGLVQGLGEFLPISSSGHLIAVRWLLGWADPGLAFDVALHLGTLVAVLLYFRTDWIRLVRAVLPTAGSTLAGRFSSNHDTRLAVYIVLATVPAALAGALGESKLEELFHGPTPASQAVGILIIGVVMIIMGGLLWLAERVARHVLEMRDMTLKQALLIGVAQVFAIIPGVSRSGSTITAGLFTGLTRETAARFSFLLGTPVIAGAGVKQVYEIVQAGGLTESESLAFLLGFAAAAVSGYLAIFGLMRYLQRNSTLPFVVYRILLGILLIGLVIMGVRQ